VLRTVLVAATAALLLATAIRSAGVQALANKRPHVAAWLWPNHPTMIVQTGFAEIGQAIASGREPSGQTVERLREVVRRDPLAVAPFLVEGTRRLSAGDAGQAELLLVEAANRDPRNPAARFLLAQLYLGEGKTGQGLEQIAALVRRVPGAAGSLTPAIAEFAKQPGAVPQVKALLRQNLQLRQGVLETLARDPAQAGLVLELAGPAVSANQNPVWQERLLTSLVESGDYYGAHQLWERFSSVRRSPEPGLFNPNFDTSSAPPPFNWNMIQGPAGTAEQASGGLHVLYYGREDARLVSQTLVLKPGRYRLAFTARGSADATAALSWMVTCLPGNKTLTRQATGAGQAQFTVPPGGCPAQKLELWGTMTENPGTSDVYVTGLQLTRAAS
jgi:hypothetical protein